MPYLIARFSPPEIPIEFAGAGAWEALVLASVLGEQAASVVVLDEPAVAVHSTLQRQLGAHLQRASAQFIVITHSADLLPLDPATRAQIIRCNRNEHAATQSWRLTDDCRKRMSRKLMAKGNERLPFAWRCVLCEGEDDVEAIYALADRLSVDLRGQNIAVADCGGRDNLPDYIRFCSELGLHYLAVMDADTSKGRLNPGVARKARAVRDAAKKYQNGELVEFPEDLETTLSITKQRPSLISDAIKAASLDSSGPPEPVELVSAMVRIGRPHSRRRVTSGDRVDLAPLSPEGVTDSDSQGSGTGPGVGSVPDVNAQQAAPRRRRALPRSESPAPGFC